MFKQVYQVFSGLGIYFFVEWQNLYLLPGINLTEIKAQNWKAQKKRMTKLQRSSGPLTLSNTAFSQSIRD